MWQLLNLAINIDLRKLFLILLSKCTVSLVELVELVAFVFIVRLTITNQTN